LTSFIGNKLEGLIDSAAFFKNKKSLLLDFLMGFEYSTLVYCDPWGLKIGRAGQREDCFSVLKDFFIFGGLLTIEHPALLQSPEQFLFLL
jgi:hypothetical protein